MKSNFLREDWHTIDGLRVRCCVVGSKDMSVGAPPLFLLHGLGCSAETWEPTLRCLVEKCQFASTLIAPDFPGYGCSDNPKKTLSIPELADWTVKLMDELGIDRAHFAGNSMGCQVMLSLACRYPERAANLILVGPTVGDHRVPFLRYFIGLILDGFCEPLRYNLTLLKMYAQMGLRRYLVTVKKMMDEDSLAYAHQIQSPCLVLRGARDKVIPQRAAQALADEMPHGQIAIVPHAAHALQFSNPKQFTEKVREFTEGLATASSPAGSFPAQAS